MILCSWEKESFTLMLPAMLLYIAHFEMDVNEKSFLLSAKNNMLEILSWISAFLFNLYCILFIAGTDFGYAGFSKNTPLSRYFLGIWRSVSHKILYISVFFLLIVVLYAVDRKESALKDLRAELRKDKWLLLFSVYTMASQLFLHAKSGMSWRYVTPLIFGFAMLIVYETIKTAKAHLYFRRAFAVIASVFICVSMYYSIYSAHNWAQWGTRHKFLLESLFQVLDENADVETVLLNMEFGDSVSSTKSWEGQFFDVTFLNADKKADRQEIIDGEITPELILCGRHAWNTDDEDGVFTKVNLRRDDYYKIIDDDDTWIVIGKRKQE